MEDLSAQDRTGHAKERDVSSHDETLNSESIREQALNVQRSIKNSALDVERWALSVGR
jgi:hypothetical protein